MTQARYIDEVNSIASRLRPIEMEKVLQTISQNYIGNHPTHPAMCRVSRLQSIKKLADHTYTFPIDEQYPDMKESETVYAWGMVWANQDEGAPMKLSPIGPTKLYVNGECVFGSANEEELEEKVISLNIKLSKGWNHFILQLNKQENRVGAIFGAKNRKNKPYHFLVPSLDRRGEEGWIHTQPINELDFIPRTSVYEKTTNVEWFPEQIIQSTFKEKFAESHDVKAYAWTQILQYDGSVHSYTFEGKAFSPFTVYINQEVVHKQSDSGPFTFTIENYQRTMDLLIESFAVNGDWGFLFNEQSETPLTLPRAVKGGKGKWLYMGSFPKDAEVPLYQEGNIVNYLEYKGERFFWQTNQKDDYMRLFLENEFFGKWNYPLGVTLYGLLGFSKEFNQPSVFDYVKEHVDFTVSTFKYSLADKELFGAAGINNQLSDIDSLDDCGSFGALMLLADKEQAIDGSRFVADYIADYIMHKQSRLPDDTLYRKVGVSESMHMTMWIDDLYMSIPFLCRYAEISKDDQYLKEAAKQLLLYKKHLFLDELNLMSHVYHVEKEKRTNTVWGRGNGWVIFSLAELLKLLPNEFEEYRPIKEFYLQMVEGILAQQGESGLWHQVLSDHQSYAESSCTSIFIYALSTGIRQGWIERKDEHIQRLTRAWEGLCHQAIDQNGNIHGICKGSSYGFSHDYYKYRLGWKTNDPHGIGIVLLAGTECCKIKRRIRINMNRQAIVDRHNPIIRKVESVAPLSVGNGEFGFSCDFTGLQSFPELYESPLSTQSNWGWHYTGKKDLYTLDDVVLQELETHGRKVLYPMRPEHKEKEYNWLRQNPHRVNLGRVSLRILAEDGSEATIDQIENIHQEHFLWNGYILSEFDVFGEKVQVKTASHSHKDWIQVTVKSELIKKGRLELFTLFPCPDIMHDGWAKAIYPSWEHDDRHQTILKKTNDRAASIQRIMDEDQYYTLLQSSGATFEQTNTHEVTIKPNHHQDEFSLIVAFEENEIEMSDQINIFTDSQQFWNEFWQTGGAIDFSESTDPRAFELERRVVLSQYLCAVHSGGSMPPQETGYMYNSWFGKAHLEMHWWHAAHFPLWGRAHILEKSLDWYNDILPLAKDLAKQQGYEGARWPKMVGIDGKQSPSKVAPGLIWQQPHPISMLELYYQANPTEETLNKFKEIIFESADFMVSFAHWNDERKSYDLGPPLIPAQECHKMDESANPPYEVEYWKYGLEVAIRWAERLGVEANPDWVTVASHMTSPRIEDGLYLAHENCLHTFTEKNHDHPSMVGALGLLPGTLIDRQAMKKTLYKVKEVWRWDTAWGWDFPMCAMTAARLGERDLAVDFLLMDAVKNNYLPNGHNYQRPGLTAYLPGNGGLLTAIAMMAVGWRDAEDKNNPGFPNDGSWKVKHEGLHDWFE